jgi:hypothetical protein
MADGSLRFRFDGGGHAREITEGATTRVEPTIRAESRADAGAFVRTRSTRAPYRRRGLRTWAVASRLQWRLAEIQRGFFLTLALGLSLCAALLVVGRLEFGIVPGAAAVRPALSRIRTVPATTGRHTGTPVSTDAFAATVSPLSLLMYVAGSYDTLAQARVAQAQYRAAGVQTAIFPGAVYQLVLAPVFVSAHVNAQLVRSFAGWQVPYYIVTVHVPTPKGLAARGWLARREPVPVRREVEAALCANGRLIAQLVTAPNRPQALAQLQSLHAAVALDEAASHALGAGADRGDARRALEQALRQTDEAFAELAAELAGSGPGQSRLDGSTELAARVAAVLAAGATAVRAAGG